MLIDTGREPDIAIIISSQRSCVFFSRNAFVTEAAFAHNGLWMDETYMYLSRMSRSHIKIIIPHPLNLIIDELQIAIFSIW